MIDGRSHRFTSVFKRERSGRPVAHKVSALPSLKFLDRVQDGFADLDERWSNPHRAPVTQSPFAQLATITVDDLLGLHIVHNVVPFITRVKRVFLIIRRWSIFRIAIAAASQDQQAMCRVRYGYILNCFNRFGMFTRGEQSAASTCSVRCVRLRANRAERNGECRRADLLLL